MFLARCIALYSASPDERSKRGSDECKGCGKEGKGDEHTFRGTSEVFAGRGICMTDNN